MPNLVNNKYQEVRSLDEGDFSDCNFRVMGRVPGKELKLGQAVFRAFNSKTREFYDVRKYNVIYFDFETLVINGIHVPYCVSYSISEFNENSPSSQTFSETRNIYGFGCEKQFLESLPSNSKNLLWAYNAGFDARFLLKHMSYKSKDTNMIDCGSKIKQAHGFYKGREIIIKDSMPFLAGGLARLPEMFKDASSSLSLEKECFPHALINESNFRSLWPLEYLDSYDNKDTLIDNATKIGAIVDDKLDCEMYATHYCNRDVDVLRVCFEAFRALVKEEFDLDIYRFLSVSSLSLAYQHNEGCFDDCYELNSVLLGFLHQGTVGGRVMARDNDQYHLKHKIADFDAVSLYPSGMSELPGYPRGKGKLFKDSIPSDADYYVTRVRFDSIDIKRHFPLLSFYENGSRNFTNDIVGQTMVVGKQALEDIVRFQGASYTVIEGIYWNEGFNDQITKTITKMFNARLKYKAEGNPLQEVLKLMMNSSSLLKKLYFDPKTGFIGADKLYRKAKAFGKNITKRQVSEWHKRQHRIQQFSSQSKRFPQFKIASNNPNEWQIDLAFWEKQPILISVDINSRIGFAKLLKNKRADTVLKAIEEIVDRNNVSAIFSDNGSEFINKSVESFFDERSISHGNSIAGDHTVLGKIDRFIRTIKPKLTKMKQIIKFRKLTQSILNEAIANYNNTFHSAINATPSEMRGRVMLDDVEYNKRLVKKINTDIPPGSIVRYRLKQKTHSIKKEPDGVEQLIK